MGRFSEIDILLQILPTDREDPIFSSDANCKAKNRNLDQLSIWDFTEEELLSYVSGVPKREICTIIINRLAKENVSKEQPIAYQKNKGQYK